MKPVELPNDRVRYIIEAPRGEARVTATRLNAGEMPGLCILLNAEGCGSLLQAIEAGALNGQVSEPDGTLRPATDEDRKAWKGLGRMLAEAVISGLQ